MEEKKETPTKAFEALSEAEQIQRLIDYACQDTDRFTMAFDSHAAQWLPGRAGFDAYRAIHADVGAAAAFALARTATAGKLVELGNALATLPPQGNAGLAAKAVEEFASGSVKAIAEGIVSKDLGLEDTASLYKSFMIVRAVCLVKLDNKAVGSGFLVKPDLVLTAAHVFGELDTFSAEAISAMQGRLSFEFHNKVGSAATTWPYLCRPALQWLVAWSPACIHKHDGKELLPAHVQSLDYALVRLSEDVPSEIIPVDLRQIGPAYAKGRHFVFGYAGGTDCKYDTATLKQIDEGSARVLYSMNTVEGMSGGPVITSRATPLALHEGKIVNTQTMEVLHNRATLLKPIHTHIAAAYPQFHKVRTVGYQSLNSQSIRQAWSDYAMQQLSLQGGPAMHSWHAALGRANLRMDGTSADGSADYFVFPNPMLERWLESDATADNEPVYPILAIVGPKGTGKSFARTLVEARLGAGQAFVVSERVSGQLPLPDLVRHLLPNIELSESWRTHEGIVRNEYIESLLDRFAELLARSARGVATVVVEFAEDGAYYSETKDFWAQLLIQGSRKAHLRFVLCNPPEALQTDLLCEDIMASVQTSAPTPQAILTIAKSLGSEANGKEGERCATAIASELLQDATRIGRQVHSLAMVDAVRILFEVRSALAHREAAA